VLSPALGVVKTNAYGDSISNRAQLVITLDPSMSGKQFSFRATAADGVAGHATSDSCAYVGPILIP